jgi:hypothetical protein
MLDSGEWVVGVVDSKEIVFWLTGLCGLVEMGWSQTNSIGSRLSTTADFGTDIADVSVWGHLGLW